jgi:mono/diheme cytochrome c family protein
MPAFAQSAGGPLSKEQIDSLVEYLLANYPKEPAAASQIPVRTIVQ